MMSLLMELALLAGDSLVVALVVKSTLIMGAALAIVGVMPRQRAAVRHLVLAAAFAVLLMLPAVALVGATVVPPVPVVLVESVPTNAAVDVPWPDDIPALRAPGASAARMSTTVDPRTWLLLVWAIGAFISLVPLAMGLVQLRRYRRIAVPCPVEQALVREAAVARGISRPIEVLAHESIVSPMTGGSTRPVIFLPPDAQRWNAAALRQALVHELEHIRRADCTVQGVARFICALYWCHPLVWVLWRRLALEAERACDDAVLEQAEATQYAEQLVELAERLSQRPRRPLLAMASRSDLSRRVSAVLDPALPRGRAGALPWVLVLAGAVAVMALAPLRASVLPLPQPDRVRPAPSGLMVSPVVADTSAEPSLARRAMPAVVAGAQTAASPSTETPAAPVFAVASVRINRSGEPGIQAPPVVGGRFIRRNIPVDVLVAQAYQPLQRFEVAGIPAWAATTRVDVEALAEGPVTGQVTPAGASPQQINLMLQSLLAERFQLRVRREVRPQQVYALVQARTGQLGPQLQPHTDDTACVDPRATTQPPPAIDPGQPLPAAPCGAFRGAPGLGRLRGQGVSLDAFGRALSGQLGRLVVDRTMLTGTWDLLMEWTPLQPLRGSEPAAGIAAGVDGGNRPSVFTAVQEQLGLRLEPTTAPVNMLVVERLELPTEN